jgi:hypothetical protein
MPFPNSPTNGQTYVLNNTSYTYNSAQGTWTATQAGVSTPIVIAANTAATSTGTGALQVVGGIGVQGNVYTGNVGFTDGSVFGSASSLGTRNRIINGAMVISQRYATSSSSNAATFQYGLDRFCTYGTQASKFSIQQNAGSVTPPTGFTNYTGLTVTSAYSPSASDQFFLAQLIEGYNIADLGFGTAAAKTVTLSFYVYSSLTGQYSSFLENQLGTQAYVATYNISSSNTWQRVTLTIPGSITGTWATDNTNGMYVAWSLGCGTSYNTTAGAWQSGNYHSTSSDVVWVNNAGATFYITGVQLEVGSVATPFERRQYGQEQQLCERYFEIVPFVLVTNISAAYTSNRWRTLKRAAPTLALVSSEGGSGATFTNLNQYPSGGFYQTANHSGPSIAAVSGSAEL